MDQAFTDFKAWYRTKPIILRTYLTATVVMTLLMTMGLVSGYSLLYSFDLTFLNFQIWRPFTSICFMGKFDFNFVFSIMFAYMALQRVETQIFKKETIADYIWLLILSIISLLLVCLVYPMSQLFRPFIMILIYVWCKRSPHEEITMLFGLRVKSGVFPWCYAILTMLFGSSIVPSLVGIGLGHLYVFVKDIAVVKYRKDYLPTPRFLTNWWLARIGQQQRGPPRPNYGAFAGNGIVIG